MQTRTLPPALFNSKSKELKRHVPKMQVSKQFLTIQPTFYCFLIKQVYGEKYRISSIAADVFCRSEAPAENLSEVNSSVPRPRGFCRGNAALWRDPGLCFQEQRPRSTYMWLKWIFSCFFTCNLQTEKKNRLVLHFKTKITSLSPATAPKID